VGDRERLTDERLCLVLNAGSSSLKFALYAPVRASGGRAEVRGRIEGIGDAPRLTVRRGGSEPETRAWVVPTDEERMIARHTAAVLGFPGVG
jgi:acetate kinase